MKNIAVFASGSGSNFQANHTHTLNGNIAGEIVLVVSNNPNCGAINFAREKQIETLIINESRIQNPDTREDTLLQALFKFKVDLICLAGYMKILPQQIVRQYERQILNIHPALLPEFSGKGFYGMKVHTAVIQAGKKQSGATIHFVDEEYDHGPVIAQQKVDIFPYDTAESLAEKILKVEHKLYPQVVKVFCEDQITWENNKPKIRETIEN